MRPAPRVTFNEDRFCASMGVIVLVFFGLLCLIAAMIAVSVLGLPWIVGVVCLFWAFCFCVAAAQFEVSSRRELRRGDV